MAFIDELTIHIKAGKGGDGVVRWRHEKFNEFAGPGGGDGGNGGDVLIRTITDIGKLADYRNKKDFEAQDGEDGRNYGQKGKGGEDLIIDFPIGSVITNLKTGESIELLDRDSTEIILKGGKGGLGNERFKSSTNQAPKKSTDGEDGEEADFSVELKLIADAGLVGLPSAGKSTLLNALTNTNVKVGSYDFTTLEPNLGAFYGYILADIPGLIEGAHEGKGLGDKFLRHISRTKILFHCISLESEDIERDYKVIRKEIGDYDKKLLDKKEVIILTKSDVLNEKEAKDKLEKAKKFSNEIFTVSVLDDESVKQLSGNLSKILSNNQN
ncbi:MAG: GTPase ObgE [Parcubacteria group bacterium CG11_big_fil_rev_8_21_14_0_20_39_22]|nr:MAG: GTPase ObgE [Parcubacteria group bacterium CG11_big_fil_rev_8_21_14_0_20_39_22]